MLKSFGTNHCHSFIRNTQLALPALPIKIAEMAAGAEREADPTKKKTKTKTLATSFVWVMSFFKSCLILS